MWTALHQVFICEILPYFSRRLPYLLHALFIHVIEVVNEWMNEKNQFASDVSHEWVLLMSVPYMCMSMAVYNEKYINLIEYE